MNWMLVTTIIAFIIYLLYTSTVKLLFGDPYSLSKTYYYFKDYKEPLKWLFPIMMWTVSFLLLPAMITISAGSPFQFTAFLALTGIAFTGTAPAFMESKLESWVHTGSAIFAALFAILWIIFVAHTWYMIPMFVLLNACLYAIKKRFISSLTFWLEDAVFWGTFCSIIHVISAL